MKPKDDDKAVPAKATETPKTVTEEPAKAVIPDKVLSQDKPKVAEKPKSSLAALVAQPPKAKAVVTSDPNKRAVYSKAAVLKYVGSFLTQTSCLTLQQTKEYLFLYYSTY